MATWVTERSACVMFSNARKPNLTECPSRLRSRAGGGDPRRSEITGETAHHRAGDALFVASGTNARREGLSDSSTKHYLAFD
ncbi:hypothetical protein A471_09549 [Ectopseudomonas mendocina DLHK]|nr:hypothetical protein A471_09549 [Pseudomonas mendocina DLHK]